MSASDDSALLTLIIICAVLTFLTRIGGHLILARFTRLHHRVEACLNAVPVAVLAALIAPAIVLGGPAEWAATLAAGLAGLRLSPVLMLATGLLVLVGARALLGA